MSIFDETVQALGFDPFEERPETMYEEWGDLVPPPSIHEMINDLSAGVVSITGEWLLLDAERTMRRISAREDTGPLPIIELREEDPSE